MRPALVACLGLLAAALAVAGCGPSAATGCVDPLLPGDVVLTEVFADYKAPPGTTGTDTGKEWFEIYNATDRPLQLGGLTLVHSRPDGSQARTHTMRDLLLGPGQYLTLGNATPDLVPAYVTYGYGADLGDLANTAGGKLALRCGGDEIDAAGYGGVMAGRSRELSASMAPDYTANDDPASWCDARDMEFDPGNFGTPGADNDCVAVIQGMCTENGVMRPTVTPGRGDLVITEIMPSPARTPATTGEWFEAQVMADVDLNGLGLDRAGDAAAPDLITEAACRHVTAGSYVVFARSADAAANGNLPLVSGVFRFALVGGSPAAPGNVQILAGTTVVDEIRWTRSSSGKALQLDPDFTDAMANDDPANFCDAVTPFGPGDLGTPAAANGQCTFLPPPGMCLDQGATRPIVKPSPGQLVITEYIPNPAGEDAKLEWFEITNTGATAFDVNDLGLDRAGDTRAPDVVKSIDCRSVAAGGFAVFAHGADPAVNGMLPPVAGTFGFALVSGSTTTPGDLQVLDGATVLDRVTWTHAPTSAASQLDPAFTTATGNDDPTRFCAATAGYGDLTNKGTPGAANAPCP